MGRERLEVVMVATTAPLAVKVRDPADCTAEESARLGGRLERGHPSGDEDWMMDGEEIS